MKALIFTVLLTFLSSGCKNAEPLSPLSLEEVETSRIQSHIELFAHEMPRVIDLGTAVAVDTDNTRFVISQGTKAVPLLVKSLEDDTNPTKLAYTAFCLRKLHSCSGRQQAYKSYSKYRRKGENLSVDERFALSELQQYLQSIRRVE